MIYTLTMNPALDKTAELDEVQVGGLNRLQNVINDAGGKGINVSKTLKSLNKESICLGIVAGNTGDYILDELDRLKVKHDFLKIAGNTRTNLKVVDNHAILSEFNESGPSPTINEQEQFIIDLSQRLTKEDILVISGSVPSKVEATFYYEIIKAVKSKKVKVILDADGIQFHEGVKAIPDVIKPNRYELAQYFNMEETMDDEMLVTLAKRWIDEGIKMVVVSMGCEGAYFITAQEVLKAEALNVKAHSSVGAGDAMVAALAYAIEEQLSLEEIAKLCSACGAGAVMTKGTKPATKEEVDKLMLEVKVKEVK